MNKTTDIRVKEILVSELEIEQAAEKAATWINKNYEGRVPVLLGLLKGCVPFFSKVLLKVKVDCETDFVYIASFLGRTQAQGRPKMVADSESSFKGKDIVIVEDIIDSGKTLLALKELLLKKGAASVKILTLLDKPMNRKVALEADLSCHKIPDVFVIGFGLDYGERFRNLPYIAVLNEWVYAKK